MYDSHTPLTASWHKPPERKYFKYSLGPRCPACAWHRTSDDDRNRLQTYECNGINSRPKCRWILKSIWRKFTLPCSMVGKWWGWGAVRAFIRLYQTEIIDSIKGFLFTMIFVYLSRCHRWFKPFPMCLYRIFFSRQAEQIRALVVSCVVAMIVLITC